MKWTTAKKQDDNEERRLIVAIFFNMIKMIVFDSLTDRMWQAPHSFIHLFVHSFIHSFIHLYIRTVSRFFILFFSSSSSYSFIKNDIFSPPSVSWCIWQCWSHWRSWSNGRPPKVRLLYDSNRFLIFKIKIKWYTGKYSIWIWLMKHAWKHWTLRGDNGNNNSNNHHYIGWHNDALSR